MSKHVLQYLTKLIKLNGSMNPANFKLLLCEMCVSTIKLNFSFIHRLLSRYKCTLYYILNSYANTEKIVAYATETITKDFGWNLFRFLIVPTNRNQIASFLVYRSTNSEKVTSSIYFGVCNTLNFLNECTDGLFILSLFHWFIHILALTAPTPT